MSIYGGDAVLLNLVDSHGDQGRLGQAFQDAVAATALPSPLSLPPGMDPASLPPALVRDEAGDSVGQPIFVW